MLASDLITDALVELGGVIAAGDPLTTVDGAMGLRVLNRLIDSSNINRGNIFTERVDTWNTVIGQQQYTIGIDPAGLLTPNLNAVRPIRLTRANLLLTSGSNTVRRKIELLTDPQWRSKAVQNVSGMPIELYNDGANPLSTYWIYMVPDQVYAFETYSWQQFAQIAALTTVVQIPAGYQEYWTLGLAIRCASPFGKEPKATTLAMYAEARADVMRLNAMSPVMCCDSDLDRDGGLYNWMSGQDEPY